MTANSHNDLRVVRIEAPELLAVLRDNIELVHKMSYPSYFCTPGWLEAVIRCGAPKGVFGLGVYRGESLISLLPLETTRNLLGGWDLRYLGHRFHPDPLGLICAHWDRPTAIRAIARKITNLPGWDRLILDFLWTDEAAEWPGESARQSVAPYIALPPDFDTLTAGFNSKKRYKLRAKLRRAEEANLVFTVSASPTEKSRYLDALLSLHETRSNAIHRDSSLRDMNVRAVHSHLLTVSPETLLFALQHDNKIVAVTYGFLSNRRFFFYQISHDPAYDELRPGTVILAKTIAYVCQAGAVEFNFLQGDEAYKFEWTSETRQLMQMRIHAPRVRPWLLNHAERGKKWLVRTLRGTRSQLEARTGQGKS